MISKVTPKHKRHLAKIQHGMWVDAIMVGINNTIPLQMYKHLKRVRLPRRYSNHMPFRRVG